MVMGKPPDKGSFPLDHFGECTELKDEYLRCLRSSNHDNMACRHVTKQYLQCRMDNNLMSQEPMTRLGFLEEEIEGKAPRKREKKVTKEEAGWVVGVDGVKPDRGGGQYQPPTLFTFARMMTTFKS
mmetsp:Transcript_39604/g.104967  ORF Transcript_39604/g.104967 Transcript_39604/m.104967 type:complete len:126 (-) Transcript_39604:143-520(-)